MQTSLYLKHIQYSDIVRTADHTIFTVGTRTKSAVWLELLCSTDDLSKAELSAFNLSPFPPKLTNLAGHGDKWNSQFVKPNIQKPVSLIDIHWLDHKWGSLRIPNISITHHQMLILSTEIALDTYHTYNTYFCIMKSVCYFKTFLSCNILWVFILFTTFICSHSHNYIGGVQKTETTLKIWDLLLQIYFHLNLESIELSVSFKQKVEFWNM